MNREFVKTFIREVLGDISTKDTEHWVNFSCCYSQWKHAHGVDRRPSAGISVLEDGPSIYWCFTCHSKYSLSRMLRELSRFTGEDFGNLETEINNAEIFIGNVPEWDDYREELCQIPLDKEIYLDLYDSAENHPYVLGRGVGNETIQKLELLVDPDNYGVERILFPIFDKNKNLFGFSGRATSDISSPKIRTYYGVKKKQLLLGAHLIDKKKIDYIILVEGLFGYARFVEHGQPVVASMGSDLSVPQAEILKDFGLPVYCFYDNDLSGRKGLSGVSQHLSKHIPVMKVRIPQGVNDIDDLSKLQIIRMMEDARL